MISATFDSLAYARKLEEAGFTRKQAEVQAQAIQEIFDQHIVTREYLDFKIDYLEMKMREMAYSLTIKLGAMLAGAIAILAALMRLL